MNKQTLKCKLQTLAAVCTLAAGSAIAGPIPSFTETIDFSSTACANYGDFQFCSAQYLNFLATGDPKGTQTTNYVIQSPQGLLKDALVVITNSAAAIDNTDIGTNIDNAYNIFANPKQDTIYGTSIQAGQKDGQNIKDPDPTVTGEVEGNISGINGGGATATAWDIGLQALADALTVDGFRRDLLIFFDNNQVGTNEDQNLLASALVCVQDTQGGTNLPDICFELVDQNGTNIAPIGPHFANNPDPSLGGFTTTLNYGDPLATDITDKTYPTGGPVLANGTICVDNVTKQAVAFNVQQCPAGSTLMNNNLGTNVVEFIGSIPELNANLETYLAQGYDLLSVQLLFLNQNDGFEDIFLLAGPGGPPVDTPEPGTLLLLGLGVLGLGLINRRRRLS